MAIPRSGTARRSPAISPKAMSRRKRPPAITATRPMTRLVPRPIRTELFERCVDEAVVDHLIDGHLVLGLDPALLRVEGEILLEARRVDLAIGIAALRRDRAIDRRV